MTLDEPSSIRIRSEACRGRRSLRHQQMERQCRQHAGRHHQQMPLAPDQRFDGTDERVVELVGEREVEQFWLCAPWKGLAEQIDIETAPELRDFLAQSLRAERKRLPIGAFAGERKDVAAFL